MLTRLEQICIQEELTENTARSDAALYVAANASYSLIDPSCEFDLQTFDRNIKRDTLTPLRGLTGMKMGRVRFSLEMSGNTSSTGYPEFDLPLRACGFRREKLVRLTIGTITGGPFKHGEVVIQTTSGAFGRVCGDTYDGQTDLWVAMENYLGYDWGTSSITMFTVTAGHTLAGESSGATCAEPSSINGAAATGATLTTWSGVGYWPFSYALSRSLTRAASGAVANAFVDGEVFKNWNTGTSVVTSWWMAWAQAARAGASGSNLPYAAYTANNVPIFMRRLTGHVSGTTTSDVMANTSGTTLWAPANSANAESQFQIPSLSIGCLFDGVREAISGARGSARIRTAIGEPATIEFEFRGQQKSFTDGGLLSGVSYTQQLPPVVLDADFSVGTDALTFAQEAVPNVAGVEFDMAQQVEFRKSIDASGGLLESHIVGKRPTFTMDPEVMPEAFFSWMANFTGNTNMRTRMRIGTSNQNKFLLTAPGLATTSSGAGDRDGFKTRQVQGMLTSGAQTASTLNRDNELVIIYQIS